MTKPKVFISHRNVELSNEVAETLDKRLRDDGYEVFFDKNNLLGGMTWSDEIYDNIFDSDVILVLLEEVSEWIQREINVARGAHVQIIPVKISDDVDDDVLSELGLSEIQYFSLTGQGDHIDEYKALKERIDNLAKKTENAQDEFIGTLVGKRRGKRAPRNPHSVTLSLRGGTVGRRIYLATGDITKLKNVDIIVNSENDYMQMARVHEKNTVSSKLRYYGSEFWGPLVKEDTIQRELDTKVEKKYPGRPIKRTDVVITSAGHLQANLQDDNNFQYIIHAATVAVEHGNLGFTMTPIVPESIGRCVINCLKSIAEIDEKEGIVSPEGTEQHQMQVDNKNNYQKINSIAFPLFGTGHGGYSVAEVVPSMLEGFREFFQDNPNSSLTEIYLCVYFDNDVSVVQDAMKAAFQ